MNDVIVPRNEVVRRATIVPESRPDFSVEKAGDRIEKNPFFEKSRGGKIEMTNNKTKTKISNGSGKKGTLWALLFALTLVIWFVVANYFATATVEIKPLTREVTLDANFTIPKEGAEHEVVFNTATLTEEITKEVSTTVEKKIQIKSSGAVVIFNAYSKDSQRLIPNTRLESADQKIFRINKPVVVPGMKVVDGKNVPGSIETIVYADVAGEEYNIGTSNFTIPGFKGDPRYTKFSAASKPNSPISGGFSGTVKVPSDEAITQAQEGLKQDLKKVIVEKIRTQIPKEAVFFPGSLIINFEEVPQKFTEKEASNVSVRAVATVFFFDATLLTQKLVAVALPEDSGKTFLIADISALSFTFVDSVDSVVVADVSKLRINIKGAAAFMGQVDSEKIIAELVGKNKKDFGAIIASQSNIHTANATIRPIWKTVFPVDPAKITIKILTK